MSRYCAKIVSNRTKRPLLIRELKLSTQLAFVSSRMHILAIFIKRKAVYMRLQMYLRCSTPVKWSPFLGADARKVLLETARPSVEIPAA
jgi:hypothetical protein